MGVSFIDKTRGEYWSWQRGPAEPESHCLMYCRGESLSELGCCRSMRSCGRPILTYRIFMGQQPNACSYGDCDDFFGVGSGVWVGPVADDGCRVCCSLRGAKGGRCQHPMCRYSLQSDDCYCGSGVWACCNLLFLIYLIKMAWLMHIPWHVGS